MIVASIRNLGLKKPIQVSLRSAQEEEGTGYDLVCGQGRIEAFLALGHQEIPAVVVEVSKEDRLLRSLVENMARRFPSHLALMLEIERLKAAGYSNAETGRKLDISDTTVAGLIALKNDGEERLMDAAMRGKISISIAMEIAKANSVETQRELLNAYESKQLNYAAIRTVKRLIERRRFIGKERDKNLGPSRRNQTSAEGLVNVYRRESQRQKLLVRKAKICDAKLLFIVTAFNKLLSDEHFRTLLKAETLATMPKHLWNKLDAKTKEAT